MVERLEFQVQPGFEERFLAADEEVWGAWLRQQKGFISRQVVQYRHAGRIAILNFWTDKSSIERAAKKPHKKVLDAILQAKLGPTFRMTSSQLM